MDVYQKIVHNTKMQMKSNKLFCTELFTKCGTEGGSCDNVMLYESIDEDSSNVTYHQRILILR